MRLREKIENHPVVWFLGTLVAGFSAGLGTYHAILEIAHLKVVPASAVVVEAPSSGSSEKTVSPKQKAHPQEASRETVPKLQPVFTSAPSTEDTVADTSTQGTPPPPPSSQAQIVRDIRFELDECDGTGECVLCDIRATALEGDQEILIYNGGMIDKKIISRAIDPNGYQLPTTRVGFGQDLKSGGIAESELVQGVPLSLRLEICDFEKGTELALVEVSVKDERSQFRVPFRAVPVRRR